MKLKLVMFTLVISISILPNVETNKKLLQAAQQNNLKKVRLLIANNAHINTQNEIGKTPLHLVQDPAIIHELIVSGADLNKTDRNGTTPLHQALFDNNKHKTMILLYSGARVNSIVHGSTPSQWAIEHNDYQLVYELVKAGAKVTPKSIKNAQILGYNDIAQLLSQYRNFKGKKSPLQIFDKSGQTKMHNAVLENNPILVDSLSLAGASINVKNYKGQTPMHIAVDQNSQKMTQKFLDLKAQVNVEDNNGETPFHYATRKGSLKISSILHEHGAAHYLTDNKGITPLSYIKQNKNLASLMPIHFYQVTC